MTTKDIEMDLNQATKSVEKPHTRATTAARKPHTRATTAARKPHTRATKNIEIKLGRATRGTKRKLKRATRGSGIPHTRATKDVEIKPRRDSKTTSKHPARDTKSTEMSLRRVTKGAGKSHTQDKMSTKMDLQQSTKGTAKTNTQDAKVTEVTELAATNDTGNAHTSDYGDTEKVPSWNALVSGIAPVRDVNDTGKALIQNADPETDVEDNIPHDYELNLTLVEIDQELTPENLKQMKYCYSGEGGFSRRVQETIQTGLDFFDHLKWSMRLDSNNLLYLQTLLWKIGRKDLFNKFVKFARKCNRTPLHVYTRNEEGDHTGRSPVTFHLSGEAVDRRHVHRLQGLVARLLLIPEETIFVNEVKLFRSIVITFLIPDSALSILKNLTSEEKGLLQQCDVDCVFIGDLKISFTGKYKTPVKLKESSEIQKLLQRNKQLQRKIENLEIALLQQKKTWTNNKRKTTGRVRKALDDPNKISLSQAKKQQGKKQRKSHFLRQPLKGRVRKALDDPNKISLSQAKKQQGKKQRKSHFLRQPLKGASDDKMVTQPDEKQQKKQWKRSGFLRAFMLA